MAYMIPRNGNLTFLLNLGQIRPEWLMRQMKKSRERSNSLRSANTDTGDDAHCKPACTPERYELSAEGRHYWIHYQILFQGTFSAFKKAWKLCLNEVPIISPYLFSLYYVPRRRKNNKKFILHFIWLWREKKIFTASLYSEGNFIKNVAKEVISFFSFPCTVIIFYWILYFLS